MAKQTKTNAGAKAPAPSNAEALDWSQESTTGFENTRAEDMGIPFLSILQPMSPEVNKAHKDHATKKIAGGEAGMVILTLSRKLAYLGDPAEPLLFIPATHQKLWQEWRPRDEGGGFVKSHHSPAILGECIRDENNKDVLPNGNEIITTSYFAGFALIDGDWVRSIVSMTSTQLKKARGWLNLMSGIRLNGSKTPPPMFSHIYSLTTVTESNDSGSWFGWKVEINRACTKDELPVIEQCRTVATEAANSALAESEAPKQIGHTPF